MKPKYSWKIFIIGVGLSVVGTSFCQAEEKPNAVEILKASDRARGGGLPGVEWEIKFTSTDTGGDSERRMVVRAVGADSLAETTYPPRSKGNKLLQVGHNMYFSRTGLRKPSPMTPRQKVTGQLAQGDIASTNYAVDYDPTLLGEEKVDDVSCYKLDLRANNKFATYDHIVYWISKDRGLGVKSDFYSVSGKLLKSAVFAYDNQVSYKDTQYPFVSKMVITDAINPKEMTTLEYSAVRATPLSRNEFDVRRLGDS